VKRQNNGFRAGWASISVLLTLYHACSHKTFRISFCKCPKREKTPLTR